jgi:hypothetical protein
MFRHPRWLEGNGEEIIERDRYCIFCRGEKARTRWNPRHWRHVDNGFVVCVQAIQQGVWPKSPKGGISG